MYVCWLHFVDIHLGCSTAGAGQESIRNLLARHAGSGNNASARHPVNTSNRIIINDDGSTRVDESATDTEAVAHTRTGTNQADTRRIVISDSDDNNDDNTGEEEDDDGNVDGEEEPDVVEEDESDAEEEASEEDLEDEDNEDEDEDEDEDEEV